MPWLAQTTDTHPHHVDAGSTLEAVYVRLGYVEVPAPGSDVPDETADESPAPPNPDPEWAAIAASDTDQGGDSTDDR